MDQTAERMADMIGRQKIGTHFINETKPANEAIITFPRQFNGYDKDEVDRYVVNLTKAYQTAYEEYNAVCAKYDELLENTKNGDGEREQNKSSAAIIAKTLVETEMIAQRIIADANAEAEKIKEETQAATRKIMEETYIEKAAAKLQAQKLIDDASAETAGAQERARKLVVEAQAEAARISVYTSKKREQADESLHRLIDKLQDLISSKPHIAAEKPETSVLIPLRTASSGE